MVLVGLEDRTVRQVERRWGNETSSTSGTSWRLDSETSGKKIGLCDK